MSTTSDLEHVLCGNCLPQVYICGTPRTADEEFTSHNRVPVEPCAICMASDVILCNSCGVRIRTRRPMKWWSRPALVRLAELLQLARQKGMRT